MEAFGHTFSGFWEAAYFASGRATKTYILLMLVAAVTVFVGAFAFGFKRKEWGLGGALIGIGCALAAFWTALRLRSRRAFDENGRRVTRKKKKGGDVD